MMVGVGGGEGRIEGRDRGSKKKTYFTFPLSLFSLSPLCTNLHTEYANMHAHFPTNSPISLGVRGGVALHTTKRSDVCRRTSYVYLASSNIVVTPITNHLLNSFLITNESRKSKSHPISLISQKLALFHSTTTHPVVGRIKSTLNVLPVSNLE